MSVLPWVQFDEYLIGQNIPDGRPDVTNRVVRQMLTTLGIDPDASFDADTFSVLSILASGSTLARTLAARFADAKNPKDYGDSISAAIAALPATGGVVDASTMDGSYSITSDIFAGYTGTGPIILLFGPGVFTYTATSKVPSNTTIVFKGTRFVAGGAVSCFSSRSTAIGANCVSGNNTFTPTSSFSVVQVGDPVTIFGHVPRGGTDNTTLNGAIDDVQSTITVASTTGFNSSGWIRIEEEIIFYTGKNATQFTGCSRGNRGTTAASHVDLSIVNRCVYESFVVSAVGGSTLTVANPGYSINIGVTGTSVDCNAGTHNVHFCGTAVFDGNLVASATAIEGLNVRQWTGGSQIRYENYPFYAVYLQAARECRFDGLYEGCGNRSTLVGAAQVAFANSKNIVFAGEYTNCYLIAVIDDRSTNITHYDNVTERCVALVRSAHDCSFGVVLGGANDCFVHIQSATDIDTYVVGITSEQWVTNPVPSRNTVICEKVYPNPSQGAVRFLATSQNGANVVIVRSEGVTVSQVASNMTGNSVIYETSTDKVSNKSTTVAGLSLATVVKTSNYVVTALDSTLLCNALGGAITITLPSAASIPGRLLTIKKTDSSIYSITVDANSTETIDGELTVSISYQYESVTIQSDGSNWHIIGRSSFVTNILLEAYDNVGGMETTNAHVRSRGGALLPGNNSFFPTTLGTSPAIRQQDGRKLWRLAMTGAGFTGARYSEVYGAPIAQQLSASLASSLPRKFRRYYYAATVRMSSAPANCKVEVGWKTNGSELETNATTWGVVAVVKDGSGWRAQSKLSSGGATTTGSDSGISGTTARRLEFEYTEGLTPTLTVKVDGTTIFTATGNGSMPTAADGSTVNIFGSSIGGYSNGVTVDADFSDIVYRVTELP